MKKSEFFDYDKYLTNKAGGAEEEAGFAGKGLIDARKLAKKAERKKNEHDAAEAIKTAFGSALSEDVSEMAELSEETSELPIKKKNSFKRKIYFTIGIIVSLLSVVGFVFTVGFVANLVGNFADNTKQKNDFAKFIYPVVITDPATFETTDQLASDTVIASAIWDIILYGDTGKYPSQFGNMTVPQLDVELHATNLFGSGLTFAHKTIGDAVLAFYYAPETKSYIVPISPRYFPYSPLVENIKRTDDSYSLVVAYVAPSPEWLMTNDKKTLAIDKYMEYVVKRAGNHYTLTSIKEAEGYNSPLTQEH